ncbi:hypothetical protein FKP32DRAFT_1678026 [Trametes sanguinea]|nr:hypothetical protein FKP32DRAFT_1678026 [Trametes sanguinea]
MSSSGSAGSPASPVPQAPDDRADILPRSPSSRVGHEVWRLDGCEEVSRFLASLDRATPPVGKTDQDASSTQAELQRPASSGEPPPPDAPTNPLLGGVRALELVSVDWPLAGFLPNASRLRLLPVIELHLQGCTFRDVVCFVDMLDMFPVLSKLVVEGCRVVESGGGVIEQREVCPMK